MDYFFNINKFKLYLNTGEIKIDSYFIHLKLVSIKLFIKAFYSRQKINMNILYRCLMQTRNFVGQEVNEGIL